MIQQLETLSNEEKALVLKAPVLVSVLAACSYNEVNETRKKDAIKLAHLKTFTADPLLLSYYQEVEKHFEEQFDATAATYFPFDDSKRRQLKEEISRVENAISKLDSLYAERLRNSLQRYANHVKQSTHSVFQDFLFPLPIKGLSD